MRSTTRRPGAFGAFFQGQDPPEAEPVLVRPVPGSVLQAGCAVVVAAMLLVAWSVVGPVSLLAVGLSALGGALVAAVPGGARVGLAVLAAGAFVLVGPPASVVQTMLLVLLVHLAVWACATTTRVTWRMRVELDVVLDGLAGVARVQLPAQVLVVVALVVAGRDVTSDAWRLVALLAAALVAAVVLPRTRVRD